MLFYPIAALSIGIVSVALFSRKVRLKSVFATVLAIALAVPFWTIFSNSAMAAMGGTNEQQDLKETPGGHYSGLEYSEEMGGTEQKMSDSDIEDKISSMTDDDVKISVTNGSVQLYGEVDDRGNAQDLIAKVKEIPGVKEVSFDLEID